MLDGYYRGTHVLLRWRPQPPVCIAAYARACSSLPREHRRRPTPCAVGLRIDPAGGRQRGSIRARLLACVGPLCGLDWMRVCAVGGCQGQRGEAACGAVADRSRVAPRHQRRGLHGTGRAPCASAPGTGLTPPTSAPGTWLTPPTSAPGVGSPRPHLHGDWAHLCPHLHRDSAQSCHICNGTGLTPPTSAPGLGQAQTPSGLIAG